MLSSRLLKRRYCIVSCECRRIIISHPFFSDIKRRAEAEEWDVMVVPSNDDDKREDDDEARKDLVQDCFGRT